MVNGEWRGKTEDSSSYAINGQNTVHVLINDKTGQQLWMTNGFCSFCDYNYNRPYELMDIDVFGIFKLAAWFKATPIILKARIHNIKIHRLKRQKKTKDRMNIVKDAILK